MARAGLDDPALEVDGYGCSGCRRIYGPGRGISGRYGLKPSRITSIRVGLPVRGRRWPDVDLPSPRLSAALLERISRSGARNDAQWARWWPMEAISPVALVTRSNFVAGRPDLGLTWSRWTCRLWGSTPPVAPIGGQMPAILPDPEWFFGLRGLRLLLPSPRRPGSHCSSTPSRRARQPGAGRRPGVTRRSGLTDPQKPRSRGGPITMPATTSRWRAVMARRCGPSRTSPTPPGGCSWLTAAPSGWRRCAGCGTGCGGG
jgi:hypothetical protein